jgi:hypothetical protein
MLRRNLAQFCKWLFRPIGQPFSRNDYRAPGSSTDQEVVTAWRKKNG